MPTSNNDRSLSPIVVRRGAVPRVVFIARPGQLRRRWWEVLLLLFVAACLVTFTLLMLVAATRFL